MERVPGCIPFTTGNNEQSRALLKIALALEPKDPVAFQSGHLGAIQFLVIPPS